MLIYNLPKLQTAYLGIALFNDKKVCLIVLGIIVILTFLIIGFLLYNHRYKTRIKKQLKQTDFYSHKKNTVITNLSRSRKIEELNKDLAPFGFAYYPKQDMFYSIMNGWQRDCGYCELYDEACAALSMIIDCEPIRFEYEGKKWLIEFWKGQYGMTTGCEIGIYNTDGPNLNIPDVFDGTFYNCIKDDEFLYLSFELRKNGTLIFSRNEMHWWLTGFKLGEFSEPSELTMKIAITLRDHEMTNAFVDALRETGYDEKEFTVEDNVVRLVFDKPHSPQPLSRNYLTELIMQTNNRRNCEAYQAATKRFNNTLDKLEYVKSQAPKMYRRILNIGSTKEMFKSFQLITKSSNKES